MNSDQTKKAREMIFGIHVHIIQGSIHAKFQDPASRMIFTNGKNFSPKHPPALGFKTAHSKSPWGYFK